MGTRGGTWDRGFSFSAAWPLIALSAAIGACNSGSDASPQQSSTPTSTLGIQQRLQIESNPLGDGAAPASPTIGAFAVYATQALEMNGGTSIVGGAAGVEGTTGPYLGGNAAAYFNSGATIQSSQTLYANSIYLNSGVSLGPVDTNAILGNGGATYGPVASFPAMPAAPTMPSATGGSTNVTLNSGSRTLAAGAYGSVTVNAGARSHSRGARIRSRRSP